MSEEYGNTRDRPDGSLPSVAGIENYLAKAADLPRWADQADVKAYIFALMFFKKRVRGC